MDTITIKQACAQYGPMTVIQAANNRIIHKDHLALTQVGLPDVDSLLEAFAILNVASILTNSKESI